MTAMDVSDVLSYLTHGREAYSAAAFKILGKCCLLNMAVNIGLLELKTIDRALLPSD